MTERHLLPNEIDLLVDGDASSGPSPLRAHLAACDDCRARYDELHRVTVSVDSLPHFTPRLRFVDTVMAQVQVVEPWHVALASTAEHLIPTSRPMRALAGVGAVTAAVTITGTVVWLATRADLASWIFSVAAGLGRRTLVAGAGDVAANALGADATSALARGGLPLAALTAGSLALAALGAALLFRRLAASARATRS